MKKKCLIYLLLLSTLAFGQNLPEYHSQVLESNQTERRQLLASAVEYQNLKLVDSLTQAGYDINEPDVLGVTVLGQYLLTLENTSLIDSLLKRGACLDCGKFISYYVSKNGMIQDFSIPLNNAIINKNEKVFVYLMKKYKQLGYTKILSERVLIETAVDVNNAKALFKLSSYFDFKSINEKNIDGNTLLMQAVESIAISYSFLKIQDKPKELNQLVKKGKKIISLLLSKGAEINILNNKGENALGILKDVPLMRDFLQKKAAK